MNNQICSYRSCARSYILLSDLYIFQIKNRSLDPKDAGGFVTSYRLAKGMPSPSFLGLLFVLGRQIKEHN